MDFSKTSCNLACLYRIGTLRAYMKDKHTYRYYFGVYKCGFANVYNQCNYILFII